MLTKDEKTAMEPYLHHTWGYISSDSQELLEGLSKKDTLASIVELSTDANRPSQCGKMPKAMEARLYECMSEKDTKTWLNKVFKGYV